MCSEALYLSHTETRDIDLFWHQFIWSKTELTDKVGHTSILYLLTEASKQHTLPGYSQLKLQFSAIQSNQAVTIT